MLGQADTSTPRVICWIARALRQGSEASETLSRTTRTRPDCVVNIAEKLRSGAWLTEVQGPTQRSSGQIRRRRVGVSFLADIGSVHAFFNRPPGGRRGRLRGNPADSSISGVSARQRRFQTFPHSPTLLTRVALNRRALRSSLISRTSGSAF